MSTMKVAQISKPGGSFEVVQREVPLPGPRQLRIKVEACGMCHSDVFRANPRPPDHLRETP